MTGIEGEGRCIVFTELRGVTAGYDSRRMIVEVDSGVKGSFDERAGINLTARLGIDGHSPLHPLDSRVKRWWKNDRSRMEIGTGTRRDAIASRPVGRTVSVFPVTRRENRVQRLGVVVGVGGGGRHQPVHARTVGQTRRHTHTVAGRKRGEGFE